MSTVALTQSQQHSRHSIDGFRKKFPESNENVTIKGKGRQKEGVGMAQAGRCPRNYTMSQKLCHFYFLNNSVKHWPILIIFGTQN